MNLITEKSDELCGEGLTDLFESPSPDFVDKCIVKIELIGSSSFSGEVL